MPQPIIHFPAEEYTLQFASPESEVLRQINEHTMANHPQSQMLSGHVQGRILSMISNIIQPKYILEIGTFTGYSAICMAEGLATDGELHTLELREEDANTALTNFKAAKMDKQIHLHLGNAKEIIPTLPYKWDLVFIDADKIGYLGYYEQVIERLSDRGIIIADNVLFHGDVFDEPIKGKNAQAIDAFNRHIKNDNRVEQVMLTVRDGLLIIKKKK